MPGKRILMPAKTVAEWGGLHEYVVNASRTLVGAGNEVVVVCTAGLVAERVEATGATSMAIDWNDWRGAAEVLKEMEFDVILSHGPGSRELAVDVHEALDADLYVMYHGANHDFVYSWGEEVSAFLAVSPSLVDFLVRIGKVEPWKIEVVPNGVDDAIFDLPLKSLEEKLSDGVGRIVMASRLAPDKASQFPIAKQLLTACSSAVPDVRWELQVLGDGPLRNSLESDLHRFARANGAVDISFEGWVSPEEVPERMNGAVAGLVTGRGAITALAAGALCVGVGARGSVGLQVGGNLRAGLWSNFGDHACPQFSPSPLEADLAAHLSPEPYAEAVKIGRQVVRRSRASSVVDGSLLSALQCG